MKIAVIGGGAAGMATAWGLNSKHDVMVYEKSSKIGGHVDTITTDCFETNHIFDNGFVVFNYETYPILIALLKKFNLQPVRAKMSVSISGGNCFTICEDLFQVMLANKAWLFDPRVLLLLINIFRFHAIAKHDLKNDTIPDITILEYIRKHRLTQRFYDNFLGPIASAIWVGKPEGLANVPARGFLKYFEHHNMLGFRKFKWFTINGGSQQYIDALAAQLKSTPRTNCAATRVTRLKKGVNVEDETGKTITYDQVVFACHPDTVLKILANPSAEETSNLATFNFVESRSYCHRDPSLMPDRKGTWMSWNCLYYDSPSTGKPELSISYYHNALLKMDRTNPVFLTTGHHKKPRADLIIKEYHWSHIQYDRSSIAAQKEILKMQGRDKIWFAGAWLGYGFHEDALGSGLEVARALGCKCGELPDWQKPDW